MRAGIVAFINSIRSAGDPSDSWQVRGKEGEMEGSGQLGEIPAAGSATCSLNNLWVILGPQQDMLGPRLCTQES